jgi:hypothetical protein
MLGQDLYCTIYVDTEGKQALTILVADFLKAKIHINNIENKYVSIFVMNNKRRDYSDDTPVFLNYGCYLEIEAMQGADYKSFIEHVKVLNKFLRTNGFKTVVVSDFEEDFDKCII